MTTRINPLLMELLEEVATLNEGEITGWGFAETPVSQVRINTSDAQAIVYALQVTQAVEAMLANNVSPMVLKTLLAHSGVETVQIVSKEAAHGGGIESDVPVGR